MLRKFLITLLGLAALCLMLGTVAWYLLGNEAFLKRQLQAAVLRSTGHTIEVDGSLRLSLGSVTTLEAGKVRLSNADWAAQSDMARVGHLRIELVLNSLLHDTVIFRDLEFTDCQLQLLENERGEKNWELLLPKDKEDESRREEPPEVPAVQLDRLLISDCALTHDSPARKEALTIGMTELDLRRQANGNYEIQSSGQVAGVPLSLAGRFGPVRALWEGGPLQHDVELHAGDISLSSAGSVADGRTGSGANISMQFSGPEFARVTDLLALPPFSSDAFNFAVKLESRGNMTAVDVNGDLGSFDIKASGDIDRMRRPQNGTLKMTATGPDLESLGALFGIRHLVKEPFNFQLEAKFENGRIGISPAVLSTALDRLELRGALGLLPDLPGSDLDITLHSDDIGRWADLLHRPAGMKGAISAKGQVRTDAAGLLSGSAEVQHLSSRLAVTGSVGKLSGLDQPDLDFDFASANLEELASVLVIRNLPAAASRAKGHVRIDDQGTHFKSVVVTLADNQAQVDGTLTRNDGFAGSQFTVRADVPDTSSLGVLFGYPDLPSQPLKVTASLKPAGKSLAFQVTNGNLGEIQLSFKGVIEDVAMPAGIDADIDMHLPSARLLAFLVPEEHLPDLPLAISGGIRHNTGKLQMQGVHFSLGNTEIDVDGEVVLSESHEGTRLKLAGHGSDLGELLDSEQLASLPQDFSFSAQWSIGASAQRLDEARLQLGDMRLDLNGTLDQLPAPNSMALDMKLEVPDASRLNGLMGQSWRAQPLTAEARVQGSLESFTLSNFSAMHGQSQVSGDIRVETAAKPHLSGTLHSGYLDLTPWLADQEPGSASGQAAGVVARPSGDAGRVFSNEPVMEVGKHPFDLDLDVIIDRANLGAALVEDAHLGILLRDDRLQLDPLTGRDHTGSSIAGKLSLDNSGGTPRLDVTMTGTELRFGFAALKDQDPSTYPPTEVAIDLHGTGRTWHEMAQSLNGKLRVFQGSGLISAEGFRQYSLDFISQLLETLNPFAKRSKYTQLECSVWAADVENGQVKVAPIVVQTRELTMFSSGTINLDTEQIDLEFNTKARTGIGVSAGTLINPFVKVGGTLAAPALELDPVNAVIGGGTAVATLGISALSIGLAGRFLSSRDPCGEARKKLAERDSENHSTAPVSRRG